MREVVEETVVNNYTISGLTELNLDWINNNRVIPLANVISFQGNIRPTSIVRLVKELTNAELLKVLEGQCCQKYR